MVSDANRNKLLVVRPQFLSLSALFVRVLRDYNFWTPTLYFFTLTKLHPNTRLICLDFFGRLDSRNSHMQPFFSCSVWVVRDVSASQK